MFTEHFCPIRDYPKPMSGKTPIERHPYETSLSTKAKTQTPYVGQKTQIIIDSAHAKPKSSNR